MYSTKGVDVIATITELRANTSDLLERVKRVQNGILIQKNNEPQAVLIPWPVYIELKDQVDLDSIVKELAS
jgi:prevent-host-death family protein